MNRSRPTMLDVARESGASLKTVSRVINGEPGVSPELAIKVERAVQKLDYKQNFTAGSLRRLGGRTSTIGLLVEDISNPFSSALHRSIEDATRSQGLELFAGSLDEDPARERQLVDGFIARRVDGLIIVPSSHDQQYLEAERKRGTHFVFVDRPAVNFDADAVLSSNRSGVTKAIERLLTRGHKKFAYLSDYESIFTAKERFSGFNDALKSVRIAIDPQNIRMGFKNDSEVELFLTELLSAENRPTAIFTAQNVITLAAVRVLKAMHLQNRVALIGFDDLPIADLVEPSLSLVTQDVHLMGQIAAEFLLRRINGSKSPYEVRVIPTLFSERASSAIKPS